MIDTIGVILAGGLARRMGGGGLQKAWDALRPAVELFPEEALVPYNLACYACQLGDPAEARQWLRKAIARGEKDEIKRLALNDPDLAVLREEIALL